MVSRTGIKGDITRWVEFAGRSYAEKISLMKDMRGAWSQKQYKAKPGVNFCNFEITTNTKTELDKLVKLSGTGIKITLQALIHDTYLSALEAKLKAGVKKEEEKTQQLKLKKSLGPKLGMDPEISKREIERVNSAITHLTDELSKVTKSLSDLADGMNIRPYIGKKQANKLSMHNLEEATKMKQSIRNG